MLLTCLLVDPAALLARHAGAGAFYAVIPHQVMVAGFGAVSLFVLLALAMGVRRFWRDLDRSAIADRAAIGQALSGRADASRIWTAAAAMAAPTRPKRRRRRAAGTTT